MAYNIRDSCFSYDSPLDDHDDYEMHTPYSTYIMNTDSKATNQYYVNAVSIIENVIQKIIHQNKGI